MKKQHCIMIGVIFLAFNTRYTELYGAKLNGKINYFPFGVAKL
jgi:hypothetical protein